MWTLLQIVQEFTARTGLPKPVSVVGNQDARVAQILGLLNEGMEDLTTRKRLQSIHRIATFTSIAGNDQGALDDIAPHGFESIVPRTMWDTTQQMWIPGSLTPQEWENIEVGVGPNPYGQYRVIQDHLWLTTGFPVDHEVKFEYESKWYIQNGTEGKEYFTADTDIFILPQRIAIAWLRWKWKEEKGLEYAEDFARYENFVATRELRENPARPVNAAREPGLQWGILVPQTGAGGGGGSSSGGAIVVGEGGIVLGVG